MSRSAVLANDPGLSHTKDSKNGTYFFMLIFNSF